MANESTYAAFLSAGGRVTKLLNAGLHESLYDAAGLRSLITFYPWAAGGSDTMNVSKLTRGYAMAAASSETSGGFANTQPTSGSFDITVARYGLVMKPSDLFHISGGPIDVAAEVSMLVESLDLTLTDLLCAAFANVAGRVGVSAQPMTVDDLFDGKFYLNLKNNKGAGVAAVLHPTQINNLVESSRGESGAFQFRTDAQGLLGEIGTGFVGQLVGVALYQSDSVATADSAVNRAGAIFAPGAFAYTLADVGMMDPMIPTQNIVVGTNEMFVENVRDGANGLTSLIANAYPGVAEAEDLRACRITTAA
jgi:hypothetical protein